MAPTNDKKNPKPFTYEPSQLFEGSDGRWSTFTIRVGNPAQVFRVLISTAGYETWIPSSEGCYDKDAQECSKLRGVESFAGGYTGGFLVNSSSTWKELGKMDRRVQYRSDFNGTGLYGVDTVGLQVQNPDSFALGQQVVASFANKDTVFGMFGLGIKRANFSSFDDHPYPPFMTALKEKSLIPSLSFGYTAGRAYRGQGVQGSLTLGGYDKSRLISKSDSGILNLPFGPDDSRSFTVAVKSLSATQTLNGNISLLDEGISALIDSTTPQLWLPPKICNSISAAFGLKYDNRTGFYLVPNGTHTLLKELNPQISLSLGLDPSSKDDTSFTNIITIPYQAMDLQIGWPVYSTPLNYFPIRQSLDGKYALGRAFLQETYLIANYERQKFSIHQASNAYPLASRDVVSISPSQSSGTVITTGVIAGIIFASMTLLGLFIAVVCVVLRRRRSLPSIPPSKDLLDTSREPESTPTCHELTSKNLFELQGQTPELSEQPLAEMRDTRSEHELDACATMVRRSILEMPG